MAEFIAVVIMCSVIGLIAFGILSLTYDPINRSLFTDILMNLLVVGVFGALMLVLIAVACVLALVFHWLVHMIHFVC